MQVRHCDTPAQTDCANCAIMSHFGRLSQSGSILHKSLVTSHMSLVIDLMAPILLK